jgi:uncharacterized protein (TIGR03905 family)
MPSFIPQGVCATQIDYEVDDQGLVHNVAFTRGCPGNALGIAKLAEGRPATELIELFEGLPCGKKATSCPAQLAIALAQHLEVRNLELDAEPGAESSPKKNAE